MSLCVKILALCVGLFAGPVLGLAMSRPAPSDIALVVLPPWVSADAVIGDAGGQVVGPQRGYFASFATFSDPEFVQSVRRAGGWWVLDGRAIAALCGVSA